MDFLYNMLNQTYLNHIDKNQKLKHDLHTHGDNKKIIIYLFAHLLLFARWKHKIYGNIESQVALILGNDPDIWMPIIAAQCRYQTITLKCVALVRYTLNWDVIEPTKINHTWRLGSLMTLGSNHNVSSALVLNTLYTNYKRDLHE